jgi:aspartate aminotransferase
MALADTAKGRRPARLVERLVADSRRPSNLGQVPDGVISLAMGEPFADTPTEVTEAARSALARGRTRYAPLTGSPALREGLATHLSGRRGAAIDASQVVVTHGAAAGLAALLLTIVDRGDRVVIPEPTYSLYADHVAMAGGSISWMPLRADGRLDLAALGAALVGARAVVLCNPSNPTGGVIPREDLQAVAALAADHGAAVVVDEAYADIVFDDIKFHSALNLEGPEEIYCLGTFSKSYAMTGWRLGYVIAPTAWADRINLVHRTINSALNTFVQDAALAALELPDSFLTKMASAYQQRRDLVVERLSGAPFLTLARPEGAFYAFPRIDTRRTSEELTRDLATPGGVLVRAGSEYGPSGEGHLRLSFATDLGSLNEGLDRFVTKLPGLLR